MNCKLTLEIGRMHIVATELQTLDKEKKYLITEVKRVKRNLKKTMKQKSAHIDEAKAARGKNKKTLVELERVKQKLEGANVQKELYCDRVKDLEQRKKQELRGELKKVKQILEDVTVTDDTIKSVSPYEINQDMYQLSFFYASCNTCG